jgi:GT2 family glycosyltransferase
LRTIKSLAAEISTNGTCEMIVVTPDNESLPKFVLSNTHVIQTNKLYPPGRMRNIGSKHAQGSYLLFIDDDCIAPENFVEQMTNILLTEKRVGAAGCRVVAECATFWNRCADQALFTAYQANKEGVVSGLGSAALAVRRDAFDAAGGFDESLMASEDWDFSLKLREHGWLCWFTPEIEVHHDHRRGSLWAILRAAWRYGKASGLTVQRRHEQTVSWVARVMVVAARKKMYWLFMIPYSCFLTMVWLFEVRPLKYMLYLPVLFLARLSYQCGVYKAIWTEE